MTLGQLFSGIADAIRAKKGTSNTIIAENFPTEIANIQTGKLTQEEYNDAQDDLDDILENTTVPSGTINITENGTHDVMSYAEANVNVVSEYNASVNTTISSGNPITATIIKVPTLTINGTSTYMLFKSCSNLEQVPSLIFSQNPTYISEMFSGCSKIKEVPLFDTKDVTSMVSVFSSCSELLTIPEYDTSSVEYFQNCFSNCPKLTEASLNNILSMCAGAVNYTRTKTLKYIGLSQTQAQTCQTLSNYQAFLDAGWTTGY